MGEKQPVLKLIAGIIAHAVFETFSIKRDSALSPVGFELAFWLELRRYGWKVSRSEAQTWLWDYAGVPHGHPDYGWTASDAEDLARQYVLEFGDDA